MKALLYCTKNGGDLIYFGYGSQEYRCMTNKNQDYIFGEEGFNPNDISHYLNGFIVAECEIDKVEEIIAYEEDDGYECGIVYTIKPNFDRFEFERKSRLNYDKLYKYLLDNNGYALHLSKVKAFDKPKELSEYYCGLYRGEQLKKAPQNMMYVSSITNHKVENCVLISIKPEWLCKILNGEKTIEVRKQILKCLKEMIVDE